MRMDEIAGALKNFQRSVQRPKMDLVDCSYIPGIQDIRTGNAGMCLQKEMQTFEFAFRAFLDFERINFTFSHHQIVHLGVAAFFLA